MLCSIPQRSYQSLTPTKPMCPANAPTGTASHGGLLRNPWPRLKNKKKSGMEFDSEHRNTITPSKSIQLSKHVQTIHVSDLSTEPRGWRSNVLPAPIMRWKQWLETAQTARSMGAVLMSDWMIHDKDRCNMQHHVPLPFQLWYRIYNQMQLCCHGEVPSLGLSTLALTTAMQDPASIVSARNFSRAERSSADEKSPWLLAPKL